MSSLQLFRHGLSLEAKLVLWVALSLALLIGDAHWHMWEPLRRAISVGIYPFQRAVLLPRSGVQQVHEWWDATNRVHNENEALQRQRIELAQVSTHAAQVAAENAQLRRLLGVTDTRGQQAVVVEVLYEPPNLFNQRLVFNKGSQQGVAPGMPVIDEGGVVGQIIRVTPLAAEAALVTDDGISVPVQILRNGLRLIAFGGNQPGKIEVRYLAENADIKEDDTIITSGIGGLFPAGLPVAKVKKVERDRVSGFTRALCEPLAHPERYRHFLILQVDVERVASPGQETERSVSRPPPLH